MQNRQIDGPFDFKLVAPSLESRLEGFREAALLPEPPQDQIWPEIALKEDPANCRRPLLLRYYKDFSCLRTASSRRIVSEPMNLRYVPCLISIVIVTGCTDLLNGAAVATVPVPTSTPENYGLYTDSDLQIYADAIDLKLQQALKNNNTSQAQELGRKRQELIAEFNRRHLKRTPAEISGHPHYSHPPKHSANGLPGQD